MVCILLGNGFEEVEALAPADILRRGGVTVKLVGIGGDTVAGGHGITVHCDTTVEKIGLSDGDVVVLPGGLGGVASIEGSDAAMELVHQAAADESMYVAAICAAPTLLARAGIIGKGITAVCYPGMEGELTAAGVTPVMDRSVVVSGKVVTGRAPGSAIDFGLRLLAILKGEDAARAVQADLHYLV